MASKVGEVLVAFKNTGDKAVIGAFDRLGASARKFGKDVTATEVTARSLRLVGDEFKKLGAVGTNSINSLRTQINVFEGLRNQADITGKEFQEFNRHIDQLTAKLNKATATSQKFGQRLKGIGKGLSLTGGAAVSAGIFGGPITGLSTAAGGLVGSVLGGAPGAAAGIGIGTTLGLAGTQIQQGLGDIATLTAEFRALQIALAGVSKDKADFEKSMKDMTEISEKFLIPQSVAIKQFTRLKASIVGAGFDTETPKEVFEGMAAAILATGGNVNDLASALVAASQVFSKGKVSAEELRQQIGERLPGAFTTFAEAMGIDVQELDKMLERGEVRLENFRVFAQDIFKKYSVTAAALADAPEKAGQRLAVIMERVKVTFGGFFVLLGAQFQTNMAKVFEFALDNEEAIKISIGNFILFAQDVTSILATLGKVFIAFGKLFELSVFQPTGRLVKLIEDIARLVRFLEQIPDNVQNLLNIQTAIEDFKKFPQFSDNNPLPSNNANTPGMRDALEKLLNDIKFDVDSLNFGAAAENFGKTIKDLADKSTTFAEEMKQAYIKAFDKMEDALVKFVQTGKLEFSSLVQSILADMLKIAIRQSITNPLMTAFKLLGDGGVVAGNNIVPYAKGGVVDRPTMFQYGASKLGIAGEAGPEAILPLKRGSNGQLGVQMNGRGSGGGATTVNYTGPTLNFNGDEYVPKSAVSGIVQAAANRGAAMGETATMMSLQNNRSSRGRIGMR